MCLPSRRFLVQIHLYSPRRRMGLSGTRGCCWYQSSGSSWSPVTGRKSTLVCFLGRRNCRLKKDVQFESCELSFIWGQNEDCLVCYTIEKFRGDPFYFTLSCNLIFYLNIENIDHLPVDTYLYVITGVYLHSWTSQVALVVKNPPANA